MHTCNTRRYLADSRVSQCVKSWTHPCRGNMLHVRRMHWWHRLEVEALDLLRDGNVLPLTTFLYSIALTALRFVPVAFTCLLFTAFQFFLNPIIHQIRSFESCAMLHAAQLYILWHSYGKLLIGKYQCKSSTMFGHLHPFASICHIISYVKLPEGFLPGKELPASSRPWIPRIP